MKEAIREKIEGLLSKEYYCSLEELNGKGTVFSVNSDIKKPYIKILAYRNCVVVCTSKDLAGKMQEILQGKNRDEIFECPFVYGQTIHYVPENVCTDDALPSWGYTFDFLFDGDISSLRGVKGFDNSLAFDCDGFTSTKAVCVARRHKEMIGISGAAESSINGIWEIGVDVLEKYRNAGLGTALINRLTKELLIRNIVPFYSASVTNISSQMVAGRCGYLPLWVDTFGTVLDGSSAYDSIYDNIMKKQWVCQ